MRMETGKWIVKQSTKQNCTLCIQDDNGYGESVSYTANKTRCILDDNRYRIIGNHTVHRVRCTFDNYGSEKSSSYTALKARLSILISLSELLLRVIHG